MIRPATDRERDHCRACFKKLANLSSQHAELWDRLNRDWQDMGKELRRADKRQRLNCQLKDLERCRDEWAQIAMAALPPGWIEYAYGARRWELRVRGDGSTGIIAQGRDYAHDRRQRDAKLAARENLIGFNGAAKRLTTTRSV